MKKFSLVLLAICLILFSGCKVEPHWSYKLCIYEIMGGVSDYSYEVKEIEHNEIEVANEEIHCFDISITTNEETKRYCCFVVFVNGEVWCIDCDLWGE